MAKRIFLFLLVSCLSSCVSTALTGAQLVYERHKINKILKNYSVKANADTILTEENKLHRETRLSSTSFNHDLLLVGQVPSSSEKIRLGLRMKRVPGVRRFFNELEIKPKVDLAQMAQDSWITAKIRLGILVNHQINPKAFKVVTEDSVVYVLGDVKKEQSLQVIEIARHIKGVRKVVRIFQYYRYLATQQVASGVRLVKAS